MATIPSTNISLAAIQAETGYATTTDISLTAQSQNAITTGNSINNTAPYGMQEWIGYNHAIDYPAFVANNVELESAAGYSLTGSKNQTAPMVIAAGNKTGLNFRVYATAAGIFFYVKETFLGATSYYYTPANVQTTLSTTDILASSTSTVNTAHVTHAKIDLVYNITASGAGSTTIVNDNTWTAIASGGSVNTSIEIGTSAACYNTTTRSADGTARLYLRGPGYNDTLVVSHDFYLSSYATATACN